ncbi:MAG: hypothetical protein PVG32_21360 [Anaerolineales bacterium]
MTVQTAPWTFQSGLARLGARHPDQRVVRHWNGCPGVYDVATPQNQGGG